MTIAQRSIAVAAALLWIAHPSHCASAEDNLDYREVIGTLEALAKAEVQQGILVLISRWSLST